MNRQITFAVLSSLLLSAPGLAQDENLLEDIERGVRRIEEPAGPHRTPRLSVNDMYGKVVDMADYRGRAVVVTFLSPECFRDAIGWLKGSQKGFLGEPNIVFVNVLYPGPTPAFSSRNATQTKIRDRVESFYAEAQERMPPEERRKLEQTEIRWVIDWKQDTHRAYGARAGTVSIFIIAPDGTVKDRFGRRTPEAERILIDVLEGFRNRGAED